MNFDAAKAAVLTGAAESGAHGVLTVPGGVWTTLAGSGYQLHSDVPTSAEWAVAVGWPGPDVTVVAARLLVPAPVDGLMQYAEPLALLDSPVKRGVVIVHHVTHYPADEPGGRLNHIMIRTAPEAS